MQLASETANWLVHLPSTKLPSYCILHLLMTCLYLKRYVEIPHKGIPRQEISHQNSSSFLQNFSDVPVQFCFQWNVGNSSVFPWLSTFIFNSKEVAVISRLLQSQASRQDMTSQCSVSHSCFLLQSQMLLNWLILIVSLWNRQEEKAGRKRMQYDARNVWEISHWVQSLVNVFRIAASGPVLRLLVSIMDTGSNMLHYWKTCWYRKAIKKTNFQLLLPSRFCPWGLWLMCIPSGTGDKLWALVWRFQSTSSADFFGKLACTMRS